MQEAALALHVSELY